jgi:PilZ domain
MDAFGSGWSSSDDGVGGLAAELSTWASNARAQRQRKSDRVPVDLGAGLRQRGASGVAIRVVDLSTHGFRAATHLELCEGVDVWLRLPGLEPYHAKVAWSEGHYIGCAFERPLHPAVVDMIVSKARAG